MPCALGRLKIFFSPAGGMVKLTQKKSACTIFGALIICGAQRWRQKMFVVRPLRSAPSPRTPRTGASRADAVKFTRADFIVKIYLVSLLNASFAQCKTKNNSQPSFFLLSHWAHLSDSTPSTMKQSFKVLTEKVLDSFLETSPHQLRSKPALTPCAQTTIVRSAPGQVSELNLVSVTTKAKIKHESYQLAMLIEFMEASGCRVSEALSIKPTDITQMGHVKIKAKKGSNDRIISSGMATEYMRECYAKKKAPFDGWSRHFVYRQFKKYNIGVKYSGKKKKSVTHSMRHQVAKSIQKAGMSITDTQKALGHKSLNSTSYYHGNQTSKQ